MQFAVALQIYSLAQPHLCKLSCSRQAAADTVAIQHQFLLLPKIAYNGAHGHQSRPLFKSIVFQYLGLPDSIPLEFWLWAGQAEILSIILFLSREATRWLTVFVPHLRGDNELQIHSCFSTWYL